MTPLRFGIVGCGGIAGLHARTFRDGLEKDGTAVLVAGAETDPGRRTAFGEKWGIPMHDSLESLLARDDIDAVAITTPSGLHSTQAIQVVKSGRHALSEKPLDTNAERAASAVLAAKEAGVVLAGIFQQRFNADVQKVRRAVQAGAFGELIYVHCETPWYRAQSYYDSGDWRGTWELDGGVLTNQGVHMVDRLLWLAGDWDEVLHSVCSLGKFRDIEAETLGVATVRLKNGAIATITGTTLAYDGMAQRVLICGTDGSAAFDGETLVKFKTREPFEENSASSEVEEAGDDNKAADPLALSSNQHEANYRDFIAAIREGREPLTKPEEGVRVVALLNAIYAKAGAGPYAR
ncbi:Gfo/Idh/MocA family oxidoreductase [Armatimonas sp.]|uniref:Gfo/Idh/MocA family protein n=1 Tax=Armatimonas sp. TaxID=1872638 RepID=UPI00286BD581|nr:Gfo/Idh/MocA family oxidoreductase [Armatimonas sp.]